MKLISFICLSPLLFVAPGFAQSKSVERKPRLISVRQYPDFAQLPIALDELVAQKAKRNRNTFYVASINPSVGELTDVYWKEENVLILLEPVYYDWKYALLWSRGYWNLDKDVVPTSRDVGGSNYLLTRKDARRLIASCLRGDKFTVYKQQIARTRRRNLTSHSR